MGDEARPGITPADADPSDLRPAGRMTVETVRKIGRVTGIPLFSLLQQAGA